jgi:hypothetical protein
MVEAERTAETVAPANPFYWATVGFAALAALAWLFVAMRRVLQLVQYNAILRANEGQIDPELILRQQGFVGSVRVDLIFALGTALIFGYVLVSTLRRTWNSWDHATLAIGAFTVLSLVFLCARGRIMFWIPISAAPLLALLYLPQTKAACGVGKSDPAADQADDEPAPAATADDLRSEIAQERATIAQLSQNLDVFEVERGMGTDVFVDRYARGLEEDTPDNAEWFSIARTVRRSRERLVDLQARLVDHGREASG